MNRWRKRRTRQTGTRKPAAPTKPLTASQLARRKKRVERQFFDAARQLDSDLHYATQKLENEKLALAPFKTSHKSLADIPTLKEQLREYEQQLADAELDEEKLRGMYGVDDKTIAHAAAYTKRTRKLADKLKPLPHFL